MPFSAIFLLAATARIRGAALPHAVSRKCRASMFSEKFALSSINAARTELGAPAVNTPPENWKRMFNFFPTKCVLVTRPESCVVYQQIYKCANNAIRGSLLHAKEKASTVEDIDCTNWHTSCSQLMYFTFVREPLTHYISGYAEFMYRMYYFSGEGIDKLELTPEYIAEIRKSVKRQHQPHNFLTNQLLGSKWEEYSFYDLHMSLMSGILSSMNDPRQAQPKLNYVGHLSQADSDWQSLMRKSGMARTPFREATLSMAYGMHKLTSLDITGARAELKHILQTNHSLRRGLCRLLERDYICFGYNISSCLNGSAIAPAPQV